VSREIAINGRTADRQIDNGRTAGRTTGRHYASRCLLLAAKA